MKNLFPLIIGVIAYMVVGCTGATRNSGPQSKLEAYVSQVITFHAPESANYSDEVMDGGAIDTTDFMLEIKAVHHSEFATSRTWPITVNWVNSALAETPAPDLADTSVYSLVITSNRDFSTEYPAGSSLNDLFKIEYLRTGYGRNSSWGSYNAPHGNTQNLYGMTIDDYLNGDNYMILHMQLTLKEAPTEDGVHQFTVNIDHRSLQTQSVVLLTD